MTYVPIHDQPKILVIDDEMEMCLAVQHQLEREGFDVSCATTAAEARRRIKKLQPRALLVDIRLGNESGLDVLEEIRAAGDTRPAIIISILDSIEMKIEAVRRGCDAYFVKPLDWNALLRKLRQLLDPGMDRRGRILIIDRAGKQSAFLAASLRGGGYEVDFCDSLASLEAALSHLQPDLVLLAAQLPDASGYDVARYLRQHDRFVATPLIFLTDDTSPRSSIAAIASGGDESLRAPVSPELLLACVDARLSRAAKLQALLERDGLTGLLTYAGMMRRAAAMIAEKRAHPERSFSLVLLDIDRFKSINDRYGHVAGNRVLASLGSFLKARLREHDAASRYGNDEFAMFLNAPEREAERILEEILKDFSSISHLADDGTAFSVTFTAAVAELKTGTTLEEWQALADRALDEGKRSGRKVYTMTGMTHGVFDSRVLEPLIQLQERSGVPIIAEIRELFLSALPGRLEILRKAVETGDSKGAEQAAHAFRSAAGNLGAARLCMLCAQIELTTRQEDLVHAGRLVPELIAEAERVAAALRIV